MKRILSILSAVAMCAVTAVPVISSAVTEDCDGSVSLCYRDIVSASYTVTIPDGIADINSEKPLVVSAENVIIGTNQQLNIFVESENDWNLVNSENRDIAIAYTLTARDSSEESEEKPQDLSQDNTVLSVAPAEAYNGKVTKILTPEITGDVKIAGVYLDKLKFTIETDGELVQDLSEETEENSETENSEE